MAVTLTPEAASPDTDCLTHMRIYILAITQVERNPPLSVSRQAKAASLTKNRGVV